MDGFLICPSPPQFEWMLHRQELKSVEPWGHGSGAEEINNCLSLEIIVLKGYLLVHYEKLPAREVRWSKPELGKGAFYLRTHFSRCSLKRKEALCQSKREKEMHYCSFTNSNPLVKKWSPLFLTGFWGPVLWCCSSFSSCQKCCSVPQLVTLRQGSAQEGLL